MDGILIFRLDVNHILWLADGQRKNMEIRERRATTSVGHPRLAFPLSLISLCTVRTSF